MPSQSGVLVTQNKGSHLYGSSEVSTVTWVEAKDFSSHNAEFKLTEFRNSGWLLKKKKGYQEKSRFAVSSPGKNTVEE